MKTPKRWKVTRIGGRGLLRMALADDLVAPLALRQHGVFSTQDLSRLGVTESARRHRLANGRWIALHEGVYGYAGFPLAWRGRLLAACFAGGAGALASHRSAGLLYGFPSMTDAFVEVTCRRWRRHREASLVVHETRAFELLPRRTVDGIPVTSPERTLLDLGAVSGSTVVEMGVDHALRTGLTTISALATTLDDVGRRGRNGTGVLRTILDARGDQRPTESPQETRLVRSLRRNGFRGFVPQFEVHDHGRFVARVDVAFPDAKVAVEFDSFLHHTGREALLRDSARRNALVRAGWIEISVTTADLKHFSNVSASLRAAIATRGDAKTG